MNKTTLIESFPPELLDLIPEHIVQEKLSDHTFTYMVEEDGNIVMFMDIPEDSRYRK